MIAARAGRRPRAGIIAVTVATVVLLLLGPADVSRAGVARGTGRVQGGISPERLEWLALTGRFPNFVGKIHGGPARLTYAGAYLPRYDDYRVDPFRISGDDATGHHAAGWCSEGGVRFGPESDDPGPADSDGIHMTLRCALSVDGGPSKGFIAVVWAPVARDRAGNVDPVPRGNRAYRFEGEFGVEGPSYSF